MLTQFYRLKYILYLLIPFPVYLLLNVLQGFLQLQVHPKVRLDRDISNLCIA